MAGIWLLVKRVSRIVVTAMLLAVAGPAFDTPVAPVGGGQAMAQSLTDAMNGVNTGVNQATAGLQMIAKGIAIVVFLGFFVWALMSGRWDFVKLFGMACAIIGFAASNQIVGALFCLGGSC